MSKFILFVLIISLRLVFQPANASQYSPAFRPPGTPIINSATFISFNGTLKNHTVFLEWKVAGNETTDQFEVEKSNDGKNYSLVAFVFGTDKPLTDTYRFYEKMGGKKISYRIKLINKNKETIYSPVIKIIPAA